MESDSHLYPIDVKKGKGMLNSLKNSLIIINMTAQLKYQHKALAMMQQREY